MNQNGFHTTQMVLNFFVKKIEKNTLLWNCTHKVTPELYKSITNLIDFEYTQVIYIDDEQLQPIYGYTDPKTNKYMLRTNYNFTQQVYTPGNHLVHVNTENVIENFEVLEIGKDYTLSVNLQTKFTVNPLSAKFVKQNVKDKIEQKAMQNWIFYCLIVLVNIFSLYKIANCDELLYFLAIQETVV